VLLEEKVKYLERQRKKDCEYILKQEHEIEKLNENRLSAGNLNKV
jgi:hypothetical protein